MAYKRFDRTLLATFAAIIVAAPTGAAWAQAGVAPTTPAEIQPGHPGTGTPQSATPAPLPSGADTPGGAARNGVITPPAPAADSAINRGAPATAGTPIIRPPGSPGGNTAVVPK